MSTISYRKEALHHKIHKHAKAHIHSMRQKSDNHKKIYAFSVAFILTLIVFMLWYFLSLPKILEDYRVNKSETERLNDNPVNKLKEVFTGNEIEDTNINNIEITQ